MSLINEALRKAQNQRNQAPNLGAGTDMNTPQTTPTHSTNRLGLMIGLSIFIVILFGLVVGLSFMIISEYDLQIAQQPAPPKTQAPATPATPTLATTSSETTSPKIADAASESKKDAIPPAPGAQSPAPKQPPPKAIEAPVAKPEPNPEIADWVEQCTISGVRITRSSSKVILNNKGYTPEEIVNAALRLKILKIEPERITFIDANGAEYIKLF